MKVEVTSIDKAASERRKLGSVSTNREKGTGRERKREGRERKIIQVDDIVIFQLSESASESVSDSRWARMRRCKSLVEATRRSGKFSNDTRDNVAFKTAPITGIAIAFPANFLSAVHKP